MSDPCRRARRLVRSLREASERTREVDLQICYRFRLPWLLNEAGWLWGSRLEAEADRRDAHDLAFRLAFGLNRAVLEMEADGRRRSHVRPLRQAHRDAVALCQALTRDARGIAPLNYLHDVVFVPLHAIRDRRAERAERLEAARRRAAQVAVDEIRARVHAELAGWREPPRAAALRFVAPGRTCRSLVAMAVRLLPLGHQVRYSQEFRADLAQLRRRQRLPYAVRLVFYSWSLRRVLAEAAAPAAVGVNRDKEGQY